MTLASETYIRRTSQRLHGIMQGIAIDQKLTDKEIFSLKDWIDSHSHFSDIEPFKSLDILLAEILFDGVVDEDERETLLDLCSDIRNNIGFMGDITEIMQCLHGIVAGIISDKIVTKEEVVELKKWLTAYKAYEDWWPLKEMRQHINTILKDGKIDEKEETFLLSYFAEFSEQRTENQTIQDKEYKEKSYLKCDSPIFKSIQSICDPNPNVIFDNRMFCFTGPAASGKRAELFDIVISLGGTPQKSIVTALDYLVIGAKSSPAWIYSTYGRKIEGVMKRKTKVTGCNTQIIGEVDFMQAVHAASISS